jgi:gamma-glutamylcyclotransferase (GGCT)/AIG2-like uncharacterized protein YtfP
MMSHFLFVYGTLKRSVNHPAHQLLKGDCAYYGQGYFWGRLYHVTNYPAAVLGDEKNKVQGEVYQVLSADRLFQRLDDYEECSDNYPEPHEFYRTKVTIYLAVETIVAWIYLYQANPVGLEEILAGVYEIKRERD